MTFESLPLGLHAARGLERDFRWLAPRGQPNRPSAAYLPRCSPPTSWLLVKSAVPQLRRPTVATRNGRLRRSVPFDRSRPTFAQGQAQEHAEFVSAATMRAALEELCHLAVQVGRYGTVIEATVRSVHAVLETGMSSRSHPAGCCNFSASTVSPSSQGSNSSVVAGSPASLWDGRARGSRWPSSSESRTARDCPQTRALRPPYAARHAKATSRSALSPNQVEVLRGFVSSYSQKPVMGMRQR